MPSELLQKYRWQILLLLVGLSLVGLGLIFSRFNFFQSSEVEVLGDLDETTGVIVEVVGAVNSPGVYQLAPDARVEDAVNKANGFRDDADLDWVAKIINRASRVTDGQKIYIKSIDEQSNDVSANYDQGSMGGIDNSIGVDQNPININTASQKDLESLWGIGPVTAQNIIEQRPYSDVNELVVKKIIKQNVFDRNKNLLTIY